MEAKRAGLRHLLLIVALLAVWTSAHPWQDQAHSIHHQQNVDFIPPEEFPMNELRLTPGSAFMQATQLNLEYLLMLDPDRLLYSFRVTANLSTQGAQPYGGWEAPNVELRGHFVGHYMSATAMMYASTGNVTVS